MTPHEELQATLEELARVRGRLAVWRAALAGILAAGGALLVSWALGSWG